MSAAKGLARAGEPGRLGHADPVGREGQAPERSQSADPQPHSRPSLTGDRDASLAAIASPAICTALHSRSVRSNGSGSLTHRPMHRNASHRFTRHINRQYQAPTSNFLPAGAAYCLNQAFTPKTRVPPHLAKPGPHAPWLGVQWPGAAPPLPQSNSTAHATAHFSPQRP